MNPPSHTAPDRPWLPWVWVGAVVAIAGAVRFACLFNDLWLDEIWSLRLLEPLTSPWQIFTTVLHDNNHPLNSLFLYCLRPASSDWSYRLLSWFTGTLTVWLAALIGARLYSRLHPEGKSAGARMAAVFSAVLFGGAYLFIHYSSEARGYAPAVAFGLLAFYALLHADERPASGWAAVYGGAAVLGLLAHVVVYQLLIAGAVWSVTHAWRSRWTWRDRVLHLVDWHLVPGIFLAGYYLLFVRHLAIGGGPDRSLASVVGEMSAFTLGYPVKAGVFVALPLFLAVCVGGLWLVWRRNRALAAFFFTGIFAAPALGLASDHFVLLFPRYFIISATGGLLLAGYLLARLWCAHAVGRAVVVVALAGFLPGNAIHVARLVRYGRGQYRQTLALVAAHTPTPAITLSGDSDLRNILVVQYYAAAAGPGRVLQYFPSSDLPAKGSQWLLLPRVEDEPVPPAGSFEVEGLRYQREAVFRHAALSGFDWYVYRNTDESVMQGTAP